MAIRFSCQCGNRIKVPDELAGRQARCKECGRVFVIPRASPASAGGVYPPLPGPGPAASGIPGAPGPQAAPPTAPGPAATPGEPQTQPAPEMIDSAELIPLGALAEVQAAAGPPYANSRKGSAKKVLIILAAVIVPLVIAGVVAVVLWTRGGPAGGGKKGPGLGNWAWYAPDDANSVAFVHVGKLAEANLAGALRGNLPGIGDIDALKVTDLQEVFAVSYGRLGTQVVVFRTGSDKPLKDLASQGTFATAEGVEYAVLNPQQGRKCLARTEAATYCLAPNEAEMKATLKRFAGRKSPRLKKDLQEVVDRVSRNDHYRAMLLPTLMGFRAGTAYGGGFSARAGSQVQYENLILFGDSKNAALYADGLRKQMEVERSVRPKPGSRITDLQKHFERRAKLKESAKINQSDEWVRVDGSIDAQDIRDVGSEAIELLLGGRAF